jgi:hypothetical protein
LVKKKRGGQIVSSKMAVDGVYLLLRRARSFVGC